MRKAVVSLFALLALVACVGSDPDVSPAPPTTPDGGSTTPTDDAGNGSPDSATNDAAPSSDAGDGGDATTCVPPATPPRVLFLNKGGGAYIPGFDDSRANKSSIVTQNYTVTAWSAPTATWTAIVDCVKGKLEPFNVAVTDVDPGNAEHVEIVFAQAAFFTTFAAGSPSVGPQPCSVTSNAIGFVSQPQAETSPANGCAFAAQLYGFALGLESVSACPDAMSFAITSCNDAPFSKSALTCGTSTPANCSCATATTQTSFDRMLAVLGPRCL